MSANSATWCDVFDAFRDDWNQKKTGRQDLMDLKNFYFAISFQIQELLKKFKNYFTLLSHFLVVPIVYSVLLHIIFLRSELATSFYLLTNFRTEYS